MNCTSPAVRSAISPSGSIRSCPSSRSPFVFTGGSWSMEMFASVSWHILPCACMPAARLGTPRESSAYGPATSEA